MIYLNDKGEYHRLDGPAHTDANGAQHWYVNGIRHRTDGPAVIEKHGRAWYLNGLLHRIDDGPTAIDVSGSQYWYQYGKLHRENGPAVINIGINTVNFIAKMGLLLSLRMVIKNGG